MKEKKALSSVVTSLIMILLVLVAIGIIWLVISGVLRGGSKKIDMSTYCTTVNLDAAAKWGATSPTVTDKTKVTVTVDKTGTSKADGYVLAFKNSTGSLISNISAVTGFSVVDLYYFYKETPGETALVAADVTQFSLSGEVGTVEFGPYYLDTSDNLKKACTPLRSVAAIK